MTARGWIHLVAVGLVLIGSAPHARAERERITDYRSDITVHEDGSMDVVEAIQVVAQGDKIKRGIYRDFPTTYQAGGVLGRAVTVPFEVIEVTRDGQKEPWHTERLANGVRVYIGNKNRMVSHGPHTYRIHYRTDRQLGNFKNHDELYWNVTGNGWDFPIEHASASVTLPADVPMDQVTHEGYVGPQGSTNQRDLKSGLDDGRIHYETIEPLGRHEGLTIVAGWPKGYVTETSLLAAALSDRSLVVGGIGLACVLMYFTAAWWRVGRDPEEGVIYPQYEPPLGMSPAAMRYVMRMSFDKDCLSAAVLSMAAKGYLTILESDKGEFTLEKTGKRIGQRDKLSPGEVAISRAMLKKHSIKLTNTNHSKVQRGIAGLKQQLSTEFNHDVFRVNSGWVLGGVLMSLAALTVTFFTNPLGSGGAILVTIAALVLGIGSGAVLKSALDAWRVNMVRSILLMMSTAAILGLLAFLCLWLQIAPLWIVMLGLVLAIANYLFFFLIKQPTIRGRWMMDQIEGFKMYLGTAEQDRLEHATQHRRRGDDAPQHTIELFEKYLPYAVALDVTNQWADQFTDVIAAASAGGQDDDYSPSWYLGTRGFSARNLGSSFDSLGSSVGSAVSSSSSAPGSSSGGGGGGFSGGGGGGGGGGGW